MGPSWDAKKLRNPGGNRDVGLSVDAGLDLLTPVPNQSSDWGNWDQLLLARLDLASKYRNCTTEIWERQEILCCFPGGLRGFLVRGAQRSCD